MKSSRLPRCSMVMAAACVLIGLVAPAAGQQILEVNGTSVTSYKPSSGTPVQDVRPRFDQRGVNVDGSGKRRSALGWRLEGNPFEAGGGVSLGDVDLVTGNYTIEDVDLALPCEGSLRWTIWRTYNQVQVDGNGDHRNSDGPQGLNWFQGSAPELIYTDGSGDEDFVYIVYGADRYLEFKLIPTTSTFKGKNGAAGVVVYTGGTPDLYTYYDQHGNQIVFFGGDATDSGYDASWQLWKMIDTDDNVHYVGHATTAATAITTGYETDGRIKRAYDSSGRRYCYTYSGGRLISVVAEVDAGGGWGDCGTETLVGKVEYAYCGASDPNGPEGSLELVTITTPLSASEDPLIMNKHYRSFADEWDDEENPEEETARRGGPGMLKMVVGFEGARKYDWTGDTTLDDDFLTASDYDLKSYATAYFEYPSGSDWKPDRLFFDGQCGCGGGSIDGMHGITYGAHTDYATRIGDTSYTNTWSRRAVVHQPDGMYATRYMDETGQALSTVITDGDPAVSYTNMWATEVLRDSSGCVTEIRTPAANNNSYTHSSGAFTANSGDGLITTVTRQSGTYLHGFATATGHKKGTSNGPYTDSTTTYKSDAALTVGSTVVIRPFILTQSAYRSNTEGGGSDAYDTTTFSYDLHSGGAALMPKKITTTSPKVDTTNNGLGDGGGDPAAETWRFFRKDGTLAFSTRAEYSDVEDEDRVYSYTGYANGQLVISIDDAIIDDDDDDYDVDPNGLFGIEEDGDGEHDITTYAYDVPGRLSQTTVHAGTGAARTSQRHYEAFPSMRPVVLNFPRVVSGGVVTYEGPGSYTVSNQEGNVEDCFTFWMATGGSPDSISGVIHVVENLLPSDDDPILMFEPGTGTLASRKLTKYNETGRRVEEQRVYYSIPGYGEGTEDDGSGSDHYNATKMTYDNSGRLVRTVDPTGTIHRTAYDALGRVASRSIGTDDSGGGDNMVVTDDMVYDSGGDGGNSHLTKVTRYVVDGATDKRETSFLVDYRGRTIVTVNPQAPHVVSKFDNLGRLLASGSYSASGGLTTATDPTSTATADSGGTIRLSLSETFYDERGMGWKSVQHEIDQTDGSDDDTLESLSWFDAQGRTIKSDGGQLSKTVYDRVGRATHRFILALVNDSAYADAFGVSGDTVVEEHQTVYDPVDHNAVMSVTIRRHPTDIGGGATTGPLDTNADNDATVVTAANLKGRAEITGMWYDTLDRLIATAQFGTYNGADFDRYDAAWDEEVPTRSDTILVSSTSYASSGKDTHLVHEVEDPMGIKTRYVYDAASRMTTTIANYVNGTPSGTNGADDVHTRHVYSKGLQTKVWVDYDGDGNEDAPDDDSNPVVPGDQVTQYVYGVTTADSPGPSAICSNSLLRQVIYPPQSDDTPVQDATDRDVWFGYNAQGEQIYTQDQEGNEIATEYDTAGRETHRKATVTGNTDNFVLRISTTYTSRGQVATVKQYDRVDSSGQVCRDEVAYAYDGWGNILSITQDPDSAIGGSGRAEFAVAHTFETSGGDGRNTVRRATTTLPGSFAITYNYPDTSSGGSLADALSRVGSVSFSSGTRATYEYLGLSSLVSTTLNEAAVRSHVYSGSGTSVTYDGLDLFGRVTMSRWERDSSPYLDLHHVAIRHDRNGNPTSADDQAIRSSAGTGVGYDAKYRMDALNRLLRAQYGTYSSMSGSISSQTMDEAWQEDDSTPWLTQTGNWDYYWLNLNSDGDASDTDERYENQSFEMANGLKARDLDNNAGTTGNNYTLTHDKNGRRTGDGRDYTYKYDVFGRLVEVRRTSGGTPLHAEYRYNALGYLTGTHTNVDGDGDTDGSDPWYYRCYDESWRLVAIVRGSDTYMKVRNIWHMAGLDGGGEASYIDSVICRDRDTDTAWTATGDGVLEKRLYYGQNWRGDVALTMTSGGVPREWVQYTAYGVPSECISAADYNRDRQVDFFDNLDFADDFDVEDAQADFNFDDQVDFFDSLDWAQEYNGGDPDTEGGRGVLSRADVDNTIGYAGYQWDKALKGSYSLGGKYHVRHRVYDAEVGRWMTRDPLGYVDGMSLYSYVNDRAVAAIDPYGLKFFDCTGGVFAPTASQCPNRGGGDGEYGGNAGSSGRVGKRGELYPVADRGILPDLAPLAPAIVPAAEPLFVACAPWLVPAGLCVVTAGGFFCVGYAIGEALPDPGPVNLPPGKWGPRAPRDRDKEDDCSDAEKARLDELQRVACLKYNTEDPRPCKRMSNGNPQACEEADGLRNCQAARDAVNNWHKRCDQKRGVPRQVSEERFKNHRMRVRKLGKAAAECDLKCSGGDSKYHWWWED